MTWKQFKEEAENQGMKDDDKIGWVDWCPPDGPGGDDYGCVTVYKKDELANIFW